MPKLGDVSNGSCVTSFAGPNGDAQLWRCRAHGASTVLALRLGCSTLMSGVILTVIRSYCSRRSDTIRIVHGCCSTSNVGWRENSCRTLVRFDDGKPCDDPATITHDPASARRMEIGALPASPREALLELRENEVSQVVALRLHIRERAADEDRPGAPHPEGLIPGAKTEVPSVLRSGLHS
jgi:hypothetical protein